MNAKRNPDWWLADDHLERIGVEALSEYGRNGRQRSDGGLTEQCKNAVGFDPGEQRSDTDETTDTKGNSNNNKAKLFHIYCQTGLWFNTLEAGMAYCKNGDKEKKKKEWQNNS